MGFSYDRLSDAPLDIPQTPLEKILTERAGVMVRRDEHTFTPPVYDPEQLQQATDITGYVLLGAVQFLVVRKHAWKPETYYLLQAAGEAPYGSIALSNIPIPRSDTLARQQRVAAIIESERLEQLARLNYGDSPGGRVLTCWPRRQSSI